MGNAKDEKKGGGGGRDHAVEADSSDDKNLQVNKPE